MLRRREAKVGKTSRRGQSIPNDRSCDAIKQQEAERIPLRHGTAPEVATWIATLASPTATWIAGPVIAIDGGLSVT
jgi:NAD(P)-dependent dehydrogenase (short-subunit alcohol dehydrogenase family)